MYGSYENRNVNKKRKPLLNHFIGSYVKTFLAYAPETGIRLNSASGGVATALLKYLLENSIVEAALMPRIVFKRGLTYGLWSIVKDPEDIPKYSGSIYAPTYGFSKVLSYALPKYSHIAVVALPCYVKAIRRLLEHREKNKVDALIIGLYCLNTPSTWATKYALKYFKIDIKDVVSVKFRGRGWPGYTTVMLRNRIIYIPSSTFYGSGLGQYFHSLGCYLCSDHTNSLADVSLADPWTLPHEPIKRLGGATLVVVRTRRGLEVFEGAVKAGYIGAIEVDPVYAVQDTTLLKLSRRVLRRRSNEYALPPSFTTIVYEMLYRAGRFLASREGLWPLLRLYHRVVRPPALKAASALDYKLQTTWAKVNTNIKLLQRARVPRKIYSLAGLEVNEGSQ